MTQFKIKFKESKFVDINLNEGVNLSEHLTAINSPILFGCRSGICGTCLIKIINGYENLSAPSPEEIEALEIYGEGQNNIRLACQINIDADIEIKRADER